MSIKEERTFAELGIPFPLFDASAKFASQYIGENECTLCQAMHPSFRLGSAGNILDACPRCSVINALLTGSEATHTTCDNCQNLLSVKPEYKNAIVCYECLRSGKASVTNDTVYGMVRYEDAIAGKTHGVPEVQQSYFETSKTEDGWTQVHVPQEWLIELNRTPKYSTIQGDLWQFCCARPMVYVGEWMKADFDSRSSDGNGKTLFEVSVEDAEPGLWDAMWENRLHDEFAIYMFQCPVCANYRGHWDMF